LTERNRPAATFRDGRAQNYQNLADEGTHYGLTMGIRLIGEPCNCGYGIVLQNYGIFANTDTDSWDVMARRPGVPLK
jgi:hypothetical protein